MAADVWRLCGSRIRSRMDIIYEDDDLLAVSKPPGVACIPERRPDRPDMRSILQKETGMPLWVVHRLDKPVSGVLVFAKTEEAHREVNDLFADRKITKEYLAFVHGTVGERRGRIDLKIRAFGSGRMGVDEERGKSCATEYRVLDAGDTYSLLSVRPRTGRRHQIRVHLYAVGHPVVGDSRYGDRRLQSGYARLMLHAGRLVIPRDGQSALEIAAPPSDDFRETVAQLTGREYSF